MRLLFAGAILLAPAIVGPPTVRGPLPLAGAMARSWIDDGRDVAIWASPAGAVQRLDWEGPRPVDAGAIEADEMLRAPNGREERWTSAPQLLIVTQVLEYVGGNREQYRATADPLPSGDIPGLVSDLTDGLRFLTADAFRAFKTVSYESTAPGELVTVARPQQIVVARYRGLSAAAHTIGLGGRLARRDGAITAGTVMLDNDYDRRNAGRHLLRTHELGHAVGFNHVASRPSIMNRRIGTPPTDVDQQVVQAAYRRSRTDDR